MIQKSLKTGFYKYRENEQTNRVIRYLKAWRDYRRFDFSSIELTILAVNNFCKDELDDVALHNTLSKCLLSLNKNSKILKPVSPYEDLWKNYSKEEKQLLITNLSDLYDDITAAIKNASNNRASLILQEQFGDRFPKLEDKKTAPIKEFNRGAKPWEI